LSSPDATLRDDVAYGLAVAVLRASDAAIIAALGSACARCGTAATDATLSRSLRPSHRRRRAADLREPVFDDAQYGRCSTARWRTWWANATRG
jgi:hypothetical protein